MYAYFINCYFFKTCNCIYPIVWINYSSTGEFLINCYDLAKAKNDEKIRKQLEKEKVAELKKKEKRECPTENNVEKKQEMRLKSQQCPTVVFAKKKSFFCNATAKVE